jgi:hypothetical protein
MRHIKLYESFKDHLDPFTRDIFGLRSEFTVRVNDVEIKASGPSDLESDAKIIVDKIGASSSSLRKELNTVGWTIESFFDVGISHTVIGPFEKSKAAKKIIDKAEEAAKYACEKADKSGDMPDDKWDDIYYKTISKIMSDKWAANRFARVGYRIEEGN